MPGGRNQSCVYGNLFFFPPKQVTASWESLRSLDFGSSLEAFFFMHDAGTPAPPRDHVSTYLSNRFGEGGVLTWGSHTRFTPVATPVDTPPGSQPRRTANPLRTIPIKLPTRVVEQPIFLGGDLHSNPGHNYLDMVFPAFHLDMDVIHVVCAWKHLPPQLHLFLQEGLTGDLGG